MTRQLAGILVLLLALGLVLSCAEVVKVGTSIGQASGYLSSTEKDSIDKVAEKTEKAARPITESEEYYIGRAVAARFLGKYRLRDDPQATLYINEIGQTVALASDRPQTFGGYHFAILDTDDINAFACPGGIILVTRGMLKKAQSEDEVAAILAHEIGHINHKDGIASISQARWGEVLAAAGTGAAQSFAGVKLGSLVSLFEDAVNDVFKTLVVKGYSRVQESKADLAALKYTGRAGYNPSALEAFLARLEKTGASGGFRTTHPGMAERLKNVKAELAKSGPMPVTAAQKKRTARFKSIKL
ncbi:MAG: M48 family metalloprotease [Deltaproteobacteria bacterium]|nr:M48 family metalloprotease [Deltaproteobacteria bacterium]MBW1953481.1 M48 family metalloprotease [Deltaproteobacteria bacterium]